MQRRELRKCHTEKEPRPKPAALASRATELGKSLARKTGPRLAGRKRTKETRISETQQVILRRRFP